MEVNIQLKSHLLLKKIFLVIKEVQFIMLMKQIMQNFSQTTVAIANSILMLISVYLMPKLRHSTHNSKNGRDKITDIHKLIWQTLWKK